MSESNRPGAGCGSAELRDLQSILLGRDASRRGLAVEGLDALVVKFDRQVHGKSLQEARAAAKSATAYSPGASLGRAPPDEKEFPYAVRIVPRSGAVQTAAHDGRPCNARCTLSGSRAITVK